MKTRAALSPDSRFSDGLHQAIEAKEGVAIQGETQTYATITLQNYFRMYKKLSGMTGTAMTEANEFKEIYKLEVVAIPSHRPARGPTPMTKSICRKEKNIMLFSKRFSTSTAKAAHPHRNGICRSL